MELTHDPMSPCSNAVRLLIHANSLTDKFVFKSDDEPNCLQLVDGPEATLTNHVEIMKHIVSKFGLESHWISEAKKVDDYMQWHDNNLGSGSVAAFVKTFVSDKTGETPEVDGDLQLLEKSLKIVDSEFLSETKFIGNDEGLSIADLVCASEIIQGQYGKFFLNSKKKKKKNTKNTFSHKSDLFIIL